MVREEEIIKERNSNKRYGSFDYDFLVMRALDKARITGSTEFRGGFWEERETIVSGNLVKERNYVRDTRQEFIESVNMIEILLTPKLDKKYIDDTKDIREKESEALEDFKRSHETEDDSIRYYSKMVRIKQEQLKQLMYLVERLGLTWMRAVEDLVDPSVEYGE